MMAEQSWLDRLFQRPWGLLVLALYFVTVAGLQYAASPTAELDQAEQLILSQRLQWGYTNQPPLYTWLMWGVFKVTGPSVAALYGVKVALLSALVSAVAGVARQLQFSPVQRQVALSGIFLLPSFIWESQRDLTHSLSAAAFAGMTLWAALWAINGRRPWRYAVLGLFASGCLLSKHNTVVYLVGLLLAVLWDRPWRLKLSWPGLVLAVMVTGLLCLPHGLWLIEHRDVVLHTMHKINHGRGGASGVFSFALDFCEGLISFLLPWGALALVILWRRGLSGQPCGLPGRLLVCTLCVLIVFVMSVGADSFKGRWLFPLLFAAPIWLGSVVAADDLLAARWAGISAVCLSILCGLVMPARLVWPMPGAAQTRQNLPYQPLTQQLMSAWGGLPPVVLASSHLVGGNLRVGLPAGALVLSPIAPWRGEGGREAVLVVSEKDLTDRDFQLWVSSMTGLSLDQIAWGGQVSAPLLHRASMPPYVLKWARVPLSQQ